MTDREHVLMITGANRGIGHALALTALRNGWNLLATVRSGCDTGSVDALKGAAQGSDQLHLLQMDVCDDASVEAAAQAATAWTDRLDVLVNNAGVYPEEGTERLKDLDLGLFKIAFDVNVVGVARVIRAFLPLLRNGRQPRIINMSSGAGSISRRTGRRYCYGASKAAQNHLTRGLATELQEESIAVVAMSPGWVQTQMGGDDAEISCEDSANAVFPTLATLGMEHSGKFLDRYGHEGVYAW